MAVLNGIKFYLAARFGRRDELNIYRGHLQDAGYEVTSRWLTQHQKEDLSVRKYTEMERRAFAMHDYEDVMRADRLIAFTEDPNGEPTINGRRGGRHVELGIALARGKHVYVVGYQENVFCYLPQVMFHPDFQSLYASLL